MLKKVALLINNKKKDGHLPPLMSELSEENEMATRVQPRRRVQKA
jgi:hypothetical protein